jgi:hypothetical protein
MARYGSRAFGRGIVIDVVPATRPLQLTTSLLQYAHQFPTLHARTSISFVDTESVTGTGSCSLSIIR